MQNSKQEIIQANIEALTQGKELLSNIADSHYVYICEPYTKSTIGEHIRHVVDMYEALMVVDQAHLVDYDKRSRGSSVERSRPDACSAIDKILQWMDVVGDGNETQFFAANLLVKSEVRLDVSSSVTLGSSLARELVFVSSHTVHHYAVISMIAKLQNLDVSQYFGVAPATVSFLRNEIACAQ